jgi:outer membrane protein insertion porin family
VNVQSGTDNVDSVIDFTDPAFIGRDVAFGFGATLSQSTHNNANYDTRNMSLSPSIAFPLSDVSRLRVGYTLSDDEVLNVDDPESSAILLAEEGQRLTSRVGYSFSYDNRLSGLNPVGGVLFRFGQDLAGLGGDTTYVDTTFAALAQTKVANEQVEVRAILEGGVLTSLDGYTSTATERYFANGKIRGFGPNGLGPRDLGADNEDALGGNIYAVAHLETDFPLGIPEEYGVTGGAFVDVGSVWGLDNIAGTAGDVDDSFQVRSVVGLTIYWKTPIGPLRLNFTHALQKEDYDEEQTFDLTIATKF